MRSNVTVVGASKILLPDHLLYRPDLDGLRAIAVLAVLGFHAFPDSFKGGFIGVDIFFVISGYLISTIIFNGLNLNKFSFVDFYSRRIRRIFPAVITVLFFCLAFGWVALFPDEYKQLGAHTAYGSAFISNFAFWSESGYFDNKAVTKPLLHLWSLGIEEQFYIIFPLVIWSCWRCRANTFLMLLGIWLISFTINISTYKATPVAAFYLPQSRFWELITGAILSHAMLTKRACLGAPRHNIYRLMGFDLPVYFVGPHKLLFQNLRSIIGLLLVVFGFLTISKESYFPGWVALLPTVGAALLISAGPEAWLNRFVLSTKALTSVGLISFSLYLWHWPLLSFLRIIEGETPSRSVRVSAAFTAIVLAVLTYRLVETPMRFGRHLRIKTAALLVAMAGIGWFGYHCFKVAGFESRLQEYKDNLDQFKAVQLWPETKLCRSHYPTQIGLCLESRKPENERAPEALFIGDSHTGVLAPSFIKSHPGVHVIAFGQGGCLPFSTIERYTQAISQNCTTVFSPVFDLVENGKFKQSTVILTARYAAYVSSSSFGNIDDGLNVPGAIHLQMADRPFEHGGDNGVAFENGLRSTLSILYPHVRRVIIVHQVPELGFDPKMCLDRPFKFNHHPCKLKRQDVVDRQQQYRHLVASVSKDFPNIIFIDPLDAFCDREYCYASRGGVITYIDDNHISPYGAEILGELLAPKLE